MNADVELLRRPPSDDGILLDRIRAFIAEAADIPVSLITPDSDIYVELGVDSLGGACIFIDISYEFGIPEPKAETDFAELNTARKILGYVRRQESLIV
jgi:acyl carrier protein